MKFQVCILACSLFVLASGCAPAVSVRPLYTSADVEKPLAEPRIEGEWISPNMDEPGKEEEVWLRWKVRPERLTDGQWVGWYSAEFRPEKQDPPKGEAFTTYAVRLVPVGDKLFFDAEFTGAKEGQRDIGRDEYLGLVPAHLVGRLWPQQDFLRISLLDSSWVEDNAPNGFQETVSAGRDTDLAVITSSTEELRNFVVRNADNVKAFSRGYVAYLCRPGADCAFRAYDDLLARTPDDDDLLRSAADFFIARANYARAAGLQRHRAELLVKDASARADFGQTLLFKRDFEGARREFATAEKVAPGESFAPEGLVWSYYLEGKFAEAVKAAASYKAEKNMPR